MLHTTRVGKILAAFEIHECMRIFKLLLDFEQGS